MARFHFVTDFEVAAPAARVWGLLVDVPNWPRWWRWLRRVDVLEPGQPDGAGSRYRLVVATALPFTLSFETETLRIVPPAVWEARAAGQLAGTGLWEVWERNGGSRLRYTWLVAPTKRWMNVVAPVARPAFSWNHGVVMGAFASGLAAELGAPLVSVHHRQIKPGSADFGVLRGPTVP